MAGLAEERLRRGVIPGPGLVRRPRGRGVSPGVAAPTPRRTRPHHSPDPLRPDGPALAGETCRRVAGPPRLL